MARLTGANPFVAVDPQSVCDTKKEAKSLGSSASLRQPFAFICIPVTTGLAHVSQPDTRGCVHLICEKYVCVGFKTSVCGRGTEKCSQHS